MATTLAQARKEVRALYGLAYSDSEDPLFTNNALNSLINRAHYWLAGATRCYYNEALSTPLIANTQEYDLGATVIEPNIRSFRCKIGSTYTRLPWRTYESLLEQFGPLEDIDPAATPQYVTILPGDASVATKKVYVIPAPSTFTSGDQLIYGAWIYPAALTDATGADDIHLPDPDIHRLYSATCLQMAMFESSRGRADAPVGMWAERAGVDASEFHRITRQATREPSRTPEVRESPLTGALERMRPNTIGG